MSMNSRDLIHVLYSVRNGGKDIPIFAYVFFRDVTGYLSHGSVCTSGFGSQFGMGTVKQQKENAKCFHRLMGNKLSETTTEEQITLAFEGFCSNKMNTETQNSCPDSFTLK